MPQKIITRNNRQQWFWFWYYHRTRGTRAGRNDMQPKARIKGKDSNETSNFKD